MNNPNKLTSINLKVMRIITLTAFSILAGYLYGSYKSYYTIEEIRSEYKLKKEYYERVLIEAMRKANFSSIFIISIKNKMDEQTQDYNLKDGFDSLPFLPEQIQALPKQQYIIDLERRGVHYY